MIPSFSWVLLLLAFLDKEITAVIAGYCRVQFGAESFNVANVHV
jgi:hypothetical protein